ncbi:phospholipase A [Marinicella rhabdoformis]|uniref:phospholipase A n=1 Tax=Marinicella rhabdoformis TaxID=2580566 RepID=UPI0012AEBB9F|nr:phospholipase A [Marinicella rhabdoformis]
MNNNLKTPLTAALMSLAFTATAQEPLTECVMDQFKHGEDNLTLSEIRSICQQSAELTQPTEPETNIPGAITNRITNERRTEHDAYVLTPHKMNYILPVYTSDSINRGAYINRNGYPENLEDIETKFQLSFKVPLNQNSILTENDGLYLGFTLQAWWQTFASDISKPFRETNYQPELFYLAPLNWHPLGGNTGLVMGMEHQSNGRSQGLSRSWNRVYAHLLFEKNNFALSLKPWYRLSENEKSSVDDPEGDDNPDIADYMGHFELTTVYQWDKYEFSFIGRQNFSTNKGFGEIGLTFPLWGKLRGYATVSDGYGESLIDYNHSQTRFGIGIALSDLL